MLRSASDVTQLINAATDDPKATEEILPLVYEEFCRLAASKMAQQPPGQILPETALEDEIWLRVHVSGERSRPTSLEPCSGLAFRAS
jgi:hypothetical protein